MTRLATFPDTPSIDAPSLDKLDAANYLNVSARTVDRLRCKGALGYVRVGNQVRFAWSDLIAFKMQNEVAAH